MRGLIQEPESRLSMDTAGIVYFGIDDCFRTAVLESAGYCIEECRSISRLHVLLSGFREVNAVIIAERDEVEPYEAVSMTRATSTAPLILFQGRNPRYDTADFDLVIPCKTRPAEWLEEIKTLIEERYSREAADGSARRLLEPS